MTPQHTEVAASLGDLIALYVALGDELDRRDRSGISERVTGSKGESQPAPANLTILEARRAIDLFAFQHAKMLVDAGTWPPRQAAITTPQRLAGIAQRLGHWTAHEQEGAEFIADVQRLVEDAQVAMSPPPDKWRHIGVDCYVDGCPGKYRVELPEGDDATMTDAERMRAWRDTMPEAVCWVTTSDGRQRIQREHVILASLAVRDAA